MNVWILVGMAVTDCSGALFASEEIVGVYDSLEKANTAFDNIEENYTRKKSDYDIVEMKVA